jgi:hypothetical protein
VLGSWACLFLWCVWSSQVCMVSAKLPFPSLQQGMGGQCPRCFSAHSAVRRQALCMSCSYYSCPVLHVLHRLCSPACCSNTAVEHTWWGSTSHMQGQRVEAGWGWGEARREQTTMFYLLQLCCCSCTGHARASPPVRLAQPNNNQCCADCSTLLLVSRCERRCFLLLALSSCWMVASGSSWQNFAYAQNGGVPAAQDLDCWDCKVQHLPAISAHHKDVVWSAC